jgi:uncharacterized protein YaaQ
MKLVISIISSADADELLLRLRSKGYRATVIDHHGGFLRQGNVTLLIGVQEALVADLLAIVGQVCQTRRTLVNPASPMSQAGAYFVARPVEQIEGGAICLVLNVERYERIG